MPRISEKKLIGQIRELKEIKPRKEWVILTKSEIFNEIGESKKIFAQNNIVPSFKIKIPTFFFSKKLAYSSIAFVFIFIGLIGFANNTVPGDLLFPIKKITEQSTAALSGETALKQNLTTLNHRINDLAQVSKGGKISRIPSVMNEVNANASALAENLKKELIADSATISEIAISLKTLATVMGPDLAENSDMKILYKTVIESQVADMEKSTLTEKQAETLKEVKELYKEEKYQRALELTLDSQINKNQENKEENNNIEKTNQ